MRKVLTAAAVVAATALAGSVALAHTSVAESNPADNATIDSLPAEVSIRFGNATIPAPQPAQLSDAALVLLDPCGARVDNDDAQWDDTTSTVTATTKASEVAGRYEMQWSGTATADGDAQAGVVDFVVAKGDACTTVVRPDAAKDIDLGFDVTKIVSRTTKSGAAVTLNLAAKPSCKAFAAGASQQLSVAMDASWDEEVDYAGVFTCKTKKVRKGDRVVRVPVYWLTVTKSGDEAPSLTFKARAGAGNALTASIPATILEDPDAGTLDLYVSSSTDSDECDEDTACADRAPDLGWIRSL